MIYLPNPYTSDSTLLKSLFQNDLMVTPQLLNPEINYTPLTLSQPSPALQLNPVLQPNPTPPTEGIKPAPQPSPDVPTETLPAEGANPAPKVIDPKKAKLNELQRWQLLSLFSQNMGYKPEKEPFPQVTSVGSQAVSFPQGDLISLLSILGRSM